MTNDPISDMLTRIRNASAVKKPEVVVPYSKMKHQIALILNREGYIGKITKVEPGELEDEKVSYPMLRIGLKYSGEKQSPIKHLKRISRPGLRIYKGKEELPVVLNNLGVAIISTSQGLMTNIEAKKSGVGGEVLCEVY